jgi:hypothetical protein
MWLGCVAFLGLGDWRTKAVDNLFDDALEVEFLTTLPSCPWTHICQSKGPQHFLQQDPFRKIFERI